MPEGVAEASQIFLETPTFFQNYLAMGNTADRCDIITTFMIINYLYYLDPAAIKYPYYVFMVCFLLS
jgi:hypothetical protein